MLKTRWYAIGWLLLLQGCASVPPSVCPVLPPPPVLAPPPPSFLDRMQAWLSSSPPTPIDYGLPTGNVGPGLKR